MLTLFKFVSFIILILAMMLSAHYLLYLSIIRFFEVTAPGAKTALLWILIFLSLSFFPSALLLRLHANILSRAFYIVSCTWLGLLVYLLMALGVIWLIYGLGRWTGYIPNMKLICIALFSLVVAVSGYGVWKAFHPVVKEIEVNIENLPDHWKNRIIVHLSDLHLGTIHRKGFMNRVAERVNRLEPDLILITGDLFDGMGGDLPSFIEPLHNLKASKGVYFITGNHEVYLELDEPLSVIKRAGIKILDNDLVDVEGLQIVGVSFPEFDKGIDVSTLFGLAGTYDPGKPGVLLYHTPSNIVQGSGDVGSRHYGTYWNPDTSMALAKEMGIDLQLSGHTHKGQLFPFGIITKIVYNGYDYGLHKESPFHLYVSSGVGTWGPPMRIGSPPEIVVIRLM